MSRVYNTTKKLLGNVLSWDFRFHQSQTRLLIFIINNNTLRQNIIDGNMLAYNK